MEAFGIVIFISAWRDALLRYHSTGLRDEVDPKAEKMNFGQQQEAFTCLGKHAHEELPDGAQVSIYLTGSAAALLSGVLNRDAVDCDIVRILPPAHSDVIEMATWDVAQDLHLEPEWLNDKSFFFSDYLPDGWLDRAVAVGTFGPVTVYAFSRGDLIAAKAIGASKPDDNKHEADFIAMNPTPEEIGAALAAIRGLADRFQEDFGRSITFLEDQLPDEPNAN
jgi:hypothetical protein